MRKFVWSMLMLLSVGWGSASAQEIVSSDTTVCEVNHQCLYNKYELCSCLRQRHYESN